MRCLPTVGLLAAAAAAVATPAWAGSVVVRTPRGGVAVRYPSYGPRVYVGVGRGPVVVRPGPVIVRPGPVVVGSPGAPAVVTDPGATYPYVPGGEPPPVPGTEGPEPPLAAPRPLTPAEFAAGLDPRPGHYDVVFIHPVTGQPVNVQFDLPPGKPRDVRVNRRSIEFDYGKHWVEVRFLKDGTAKVTYDD